MLSRLFAQANGDYALPDEEAPLESEVKLREFASSGKRPYPVPRARRFLRPRAPSLLSAT